MSQLCTCRELNILVTSYVGKGGYEGDGDITKPENLEEFQSYVLTCTEDQGVHFVMADGVSVISKLCGWLGGFCCYTRS